MRANVSFVRLAVGSNWCTERDQNVYLVSCGLALEVSCIASMTVADNIQLFPWGKMVLSNCFLNLSCNSSSVGNCILQSKPENHRGFMEGVTYLLHKRGILVPVF